ncbi:MAG TPA: SET domain-containing protein-lysine N-methyltransferase [Candidatus Thermoplasmatota archaeon]|nr:SET domain-containing protein-lysine N-methyltransferase [Candidatus Thermoplasmatota archaeon]
MAGRLPVRNPSRARKRDPWPRLAIRPTSRTGLGLFAVATFAPGDRIAVIEGETITATYDSRYRLGSRWYGVGPHAWVDPYLDNPGRFVNHSCDPNARIDARLAIVALRTIRRGEQVCVDYSLTEEDPEWSMRCRCGAAGCRGVIRAGRVFEH